MALLVNIPPASNSGGGNPVQASISAYADSKIAFTNPWTLFDDELLNLWTNTPGGSGTRNRGPISTVDLSSGPTAGSAGQQAFGSSITGGFPFFVAGAIGGKFYVEFRGRLTTAIDAQAAAGLGDNSLLMFGARGAGSTTNWVAFFDNGPTTLASSIAVDNGTWHVFRIWRTGGVTFFQVDSETPVSSATAFPSGDVRLFLTVVNGTTATSRNMQYDYVFLRGERP